MTPAILTYLHDAAARAAHPSSLRAAPTAGEMAAAASWLLDDVCARRQLDPDDVKILLAEWYLAELEDASSDAMVALAEWLIDTRGALAMEGLQVIGGQS